MIFPDSCRVRIPLPNLPEFENSQSTDKLSGAAFKMPFGLYTSLEKYRKALKAAQKTLEKFYPNGDARFTRRTLFSRTPQTTPTMGNSTNFTYLLAKRGELTSEEID